MRIAGIVEESIVDGPGLRMTVFVQGCSRRCPGCHNQKTWDPAGGKEMAVDEIIELYRQNPLLDGVTLSGGEPFEQAGELAALARKVREMGGNVISYSGYTLEELEKKEEARELLSELDALVDGPFIQARKSLELKFRGSANQRWLNRADGEFVEGEPDEFCAQDFKPSM